MKRSRFLWSTLAVLGLLLMLYGLFALTFREGGGSTYVMIGGHRADAQLVGAISLVVGLATILCARMYARRGQLDD